MENKVIKISHEQWLASGIRKGYVNPEDDGTFTLKKEAFLGSLVGVGAKLLANPYVRSGLIGGGLGAITNLVGRSNLIQAAQDWWKGGSETPEMLKALQDAKGRLEQEVMPNLLGISDRLDADLRRIQDKINERIQTFSQRLTERGLGPAFEKGQQMVMDEQMMNEMMIAAQTPPTNYNMIQDKIKITPRGTPATGGSTTTTPATGGTSSGTSSAGGVSSGDVAAKPPAEGGAKPQNSGRNTGGFSALERALSEGSK